MTFIPSQIHFDPIADPAAQIQAYQARFTMLSERLIRMEYSPSGQFEDRPSQAFWFRRQPAPDFKVHQTPERVAIDTDYLHLEYQARPQGFTADSLSVLVKATGCTWHYGDPPWRGGNLLGAARTLDEAVGKVRLEPGLVGRSGWALVDDSRSLVFNQDGWLEVRRRPDNIDLYFFGYAHDYPAALYEFSQVAGEAPLIPRWILGNWWSRYWPYSQDELLILMQEFKEHKIPLAVCIVDMDWHITDTGNHSSGWTGYTWNRALFPDPEGFLAQLHELGLKTALNLHPADGIHPHEAHYRELAEFLGLDPGDLEPIPFDSADPKFIQGYFEILHHPFEAQGIDFWWLDWQQGAQSRLVGLDPLWWLNHLHFYDLGRDGVRRPFIFSRWGGLGNHRYPIGFSGDTVIGWEALANLPSFTATAANVGYGWWSHDIGGHMGGVEDDELYARWVQYGVFSPILRLHSTNNPYHERRPWRRGLAAGHAAASAMRLRHALIPYLYSMAWRHHTTSLPLITPMYYSHPEYEQAYQSVQQYWFGSELVAAPFTSPAHVETRLAHQNVWLPEGEWFDFFSGERLLGGEWRMVFGTLEDIPVFAPAGAIVPLAVEADWGGLENPMELHLVVFPGADNRFELVEDDGQTMGYRRGAYALTAISQKWGENEMSIHIASARGDLSMLPEQRRVQILLRGFSPDIQITGRLNGQSMRLPFEYDSNTETLTLELLTMKPTDEFLLVVRAPGGVMSRRDRTGEKLRKFLSAFRLESMTKQEIDASWPKILAGQRSFESFFALSDTQRSVLAQLAKQSLG